MGHTDVDNLKGMFEKLQGSQAELFDYSSSLGWLDISITYAAKHLILFLSGSGKIKFGKTKWTLDKLTIEKRSENTYYVSDKENGFEVVCQAIGLFEEVE